MPNLFRRLLGEGALTAAFIPIFKRKEIKEGEARGLAVLLVERRLRPVESVQIGDEVLEAAVVRSPAEEMPVEAPVVVPLV